MQPRTRLLELVPNRFTSAAHVQCKRILQARNKPSTQSSHTERFLTHDLIAVRPVLRTGKLEIKTPGQRLSASAKLYGETFAAIGACSRTLEINVSGERRKPTPQMNLFTRSVQMPDDAFFLSLSHSLTLRVCSFRFRFRSLPWPSRLSSPEFAH